MTVPKPGQEQESVERWEIVSGRLLSGLVILFLAMDSVMKLLVIQPVIEATAQLGWPTDATTIRILGGILLAATLLYAWRPTALLGAILVTAYLGGAVATHARIGNPLFTHILFGAYLGVMTWAGLWLRDPQLRRLLPMAAFDPGRDS